MAHDKKLNEAIALSIDLEGAATGRTTVKEIRSRVSVAYPDRFWHPYDLREAHNDYLGKQIIKTFKAPLSTDYIERNLPNIKVKHRNILGEVPSWFYVRGIQEWVFSLMANPDQWDDGGDMRQDMVEILIEQITVYRERAELLRMESVGSLFELITGDPAPLRP